VPEALRPLYLETENDEGETVYRFNIELAGKKLGDFDNVVTQRQTARQRIQELESALGGKDPATLMERIAEIEAAEKEKAKDVATKKGDFERLKAELEAEQEKAKQAWEKERTELERAVEEALVDTQAMAEMNVLGAKAKALLPHVRSQVRVVRLEDGRRVVRVKDVESGEDSYRTDFRTGDPLTIRQLLEEMAEDEEFSPLFPDEGRAGSGAPPKAASSGAAQALKHGAGVFLSREDAKDVDKYRRAKEQAEQAGADLVIADN
jgi:hypothetical protein